jgi:hypothetical protein
MERGRSGHYKPRVTLDLADEERAALVNRGTVEIEASKFAYSRGWVYP